MIGRKIDQPYGLASSRPCPSCDSRWCSNGPVYTSKRNVPAGGSASVVTTDARVASADVRVPNRDAVGTGLRGIPVATAPANGRAFCSGARTAVKKYFDFSATHSNGPFRIARSPGSSDAKVVFWVLSALVTTAYSR